MDVTSDAAYGKPSKTDENIIEVVKISLNSAAMHQNKHNISEFSQLCVELKQLYVAITRAKNRIIIYDSQQQASRGLVQDFWKRLGCAELITKDVLEGKSV